MARPKDEWSPAARARARALAALVRAVLLSACLVVLYYVLPMDRANDAVSMAELAGGLVGVCLLIGYQTVAVSRAPHPRLRAIEALATTLALFLVMFASAYYLLELDRPESFTEPLTRTDALYFAVSVFATVGFGDIAAHTQPARVITMVQMAADVVLVGVAARVLVGAVRVGLRRQAADERSEMP